MSEAEPKGEAEEVPTPVSESREFTYMLDRCSSCGDVTPRWQRTPSRDRRTGAIRGVPLLRFGRCAVCAAAIHGKARRAARDETNEAKESAA
jgi:hypothetical protein